MFLGEENYFEEEITKKLYYTTRVQTGPWGKARVYICGDKIDVDNYFSIVAQAFLAERDCAVFSEIDIRKTEKEDFVLKILKEYWNEELQKMNLFVVLLSKHVQQCGYEQVNSYLEFAKENGIVLLPVAVEDLDVHSFREKFGEIQYLSLSGEGEKALPFSEKVKQFLDKKIPDNQMIETIHKNFKLNMFISYRKKDRKYADELIRKIHKFENFEGVGVWYDEFLTSGENYNDNIREKITACDLFVMCITPKMIDVPNYVWKYEYKQAVKENKKILMIKMKEVDDDDVYQLYPDGGMIIDAWNHEELFYSMLDAVKEFHLQQSSPWELPRESYLLGCAYLDGIGVEVNKEKALRLFEYASSEWYMDATLKLIDMYLYGDGVKIDYKKVISLRKQVVKYCELKAHGSHDIDDMELYLSALHNLSLDYLDTRQIDKNLECCEKMHGIISQHMTTSGGHPRWALKFMDICLQLSDTVENLDEKINYAKQGLKAVEDLLQLCVKYPVIFELASTDELNGLVVLNQKSMHFHECLGRIYFDTESSKAIMHFERTIELGKSLNTINGSNMYIKKDMLKVYGANISLCILRDKIDEVSAHFDAYKRLAEEYYLQTNESKYIRVLIGHTIDIVKVLSEKERNEEAIEYLLDTLKLVEGISKEQKVYGDAMLIGRLYGILSLEYNELYKFKEAEECAIKGIKNLHLLDKMARNSEYLDLLRGCYKCLAGIFPSDEANYSEPIDISKEVLRFLVFADIGAYDMEHLEDMKQMGYQIMVFELKRRNVYEACRILNSVFLLYKKYAQKNPTVNILNEAVEISLKLGDIYRAINLYEAKRYYYEALNLDSEIYSLNKADEIRANIAKDHTLVAEVADSNINEKRFHIMKACEILDDLRTKDCKYEQEFFNAYQMLKEVLE